MKRVWIVQPYVPRYRVTLFEKLKAHLSECGVELKIAAGGAKNAHQADRGDEARPEWLEPVAWSRLGMAQASHARKLYRGADAVIFPHEGSNLELSAAILARISGGATRVGVWGHIQNYVNDPHPVDVAIERWQLRRADAIFAYTASGASFARAAGAPTHKIVTLNNTIDTDGLRSTIESLDDGSVQAFAGKYNLVPAQTIAYIGGLDESKRIDMLADVLDRLWALQPDIKLIVGGQGRCSDLLDGAEARGQVIRLGYVDAKIKALIGATAQLIVNPGRVGLLAVDALVLGLPLVTTRWRYHAPEIEYLTEGSTVFMSPDDAASYARLVVSLLTGAIPRTTSKVSYGVPLLEDMVSRFSQGIFDMLHRAR